MVQTLFLAQVRQMEVVVAVMLYHLLAETEGPVDLVEELEEVSELPVDLLEEPLIRQALEGLLATETEGQIAQILGVAREVVEPVGLGWTRQEQPRVPPEVLEDQIVFRDHPYPMRLEVGADLGERQDLSLEELPEILAEETVGMDQQTMLMQPGFLQVEEGVYLLHQIGAEVAAVVVEITLVGEMDVAETEGAGWSSSAI